MSLVSTWVKAKDGLFYKNPELSDKDWFICFDDDDPPELVIKKKSQLKPEDIFKSIELKYSELRENKASGMRTFDSNYDHFEDAISYFFQIESRIDPKFITFSDGTTKSSNEEGQGVFYDPK